MEELDIKKFGYDETFLKILISSIDKIFAYWNITEEYNNSFKEKYGEDFFEKTKAFLILRNLINNEEEKIELKEYTNNYYIRFKYSNTFYQVELVRVGIDDDKDYGFRLISNKIQTPNLRVDLKRFDNKNIKIKNIKKGIEIEANEFKKEDVEKLYNDEIMPAWTEYKKENGYRE